MDDSDDEAPTLSVHTMAALQEFYADQAKEEEKLKEAREGKLNNVQLQENWFQKDIFQTEEQLSQFWYTNETAETLAAEALEIAGPNGRIACVSSPTAYKKINDIKPETCTAKCLEFDTRFEIYKEDFVYYDYKEPLKLPEEWKNSFDVVIADPPFLSEECLCRTAVTIRYLAKDKIILCTGAIMEETADKLLGLKKQKFIPRHSNNLENEFRCYTNYASTRFNSSS